MQQQLEQVQKKLGFLAPDRLAEVEDFIDFFSVHDKKLLTVRLGVLAGQVIAINQSVAL